MPDGVHVGYFAGEHPDGFLIHSRFFDDFDGHSLCKRIPKRKLRALSHPETPENPATATRKISNCQAKCRGHKLIPVQISWTTTRSQFHVTLKWHLLHYQQSSCFRISTTARIQFELLERRKRRKRTLAPRSGGTINEQQWMRRM